tara:strand:+ start:189 stop:413 length:225 start_codon:yes stop_codon:yes gene_type:complete
MKYDEQKVYDDLFDHVTHLLNEHQLPVSLIAGSLMAIAQRLYRTHLNEEEYKRIMDIARFTEVEPYNITKETIH